MKIVKVKRKNRIAYSQDFLENLPNLDRDIKVLKTLIADSNPKYFETKVRNFVKRLITEEATMKELIAELGYSDVS